MSKHAYVKAYPREYLANLAAASEGCWDSSLRPVMTGGTYI